MTKPNTNNKSFKDMEVAISLMNELSKCEKLKCKDAMKNSATASKEAQEVIKDLQKQWLNKKISMKQHTKLYNETSNKYHNSDEMAKLRLCSYNNCRNQFLKSLQYSIDFRVRNMCDTKRLTYEKDMCDIAIEGQRLLASLKKEKNTMIVQNKILDFYRRWFLTNNKIT